MSQLPMAAATQRALAAYLRVPSHALLLHGSAGSGLEAIAGYLAQRLGRDAAHRLVFQPEAGLISIETIRQLYSQTRSRRTQPLVVVFEAADTMSIDAQNAFLKLLEEPPAYVYFVLATSAPEALLPTIRSRLAVVGVGTISLPQSQQLAAALCPDDPQRQQRALFLATGLPGELKRVCTDDAYYRQCVEQIEQARAWLQADGYHRLQLTQPFMASRDSLAGLIRMLARLLMHSTARSPLARRTVGLMSALDDCLEALAANGNVKANALRLVWVVSAQ